MGGKGTPAPPNYAQIAQEQGIADKAALAQQTFANRPTQVTPWGTTRYTTSAGVDPATGTPVTNWTQILDLHPSAQMGLDHQLNLANARSIFANANNQRFRDAMAAPVDYDQFREVAEIEDPLAFRRRAEDAVYDQFTSRLDPQWDQRTEETEAMLRNRGLRPGDQAYDTAMGNLERARTDAYQTALRGATDAGRAEQQTLYGQQLGYQAQTAGLREQEIQELLRRRETPVREQNLLLAGQGIQPPSSPSFMSSGQAAAPNLMGAAQAQYGAAADAFNAEQAQRQALLSGLTTAAVGFISDRRLKRDIERVGTWRGYPLYIYDYVWGETSIGVMADEVNADAVFTRPDGYQMVDYSKVREQAHAH